jgi:diguanylate cyclase (GGDEF)-like protein/PAS domain S-box-containing protein
LDALHSLATLATRRSPTTADVVEACALIRDELGGRDAYVIRAGDPDFVRMGCDCPPDDYEIKQKGYWLIWREAVSKSDVPAGLFDVTDRIVQPGARPVSAGRPATHLATLLPGDESNSELLIIRGPWETGITDESIRFVIVARPLIAALVSNVLDARRQDRQRAQLDSISAVAGALSHASGNENVLEAVATALAKASGMDWVAITIYDEPAQDVSDRVINLARHSTTETARMFTEGPVTRTSDTSELVGVTLARTGGGVFLPDVFDADEDDEPHMAVMREFMPGLRRYYERAHILSVAILPIVFQGMVIGDLSFSSSTRRSFDQAEREFLQALVSQAATTIKALRLFRHLEESREELRCSEERFRSLVQNASDLVTVVEGDTRISYQSPSVKRLLGFEPDDVVGMRLSDLLHPGDVPQAHAVLNGAMSRPDGHAVVEARMHHTDGSWRDVELIGSNQFQNPAIRGFVLNIRDVTDRKILEEQLRHQALHDPLTKLANRTRFADRLEHALVRHAESGNSLAVLFMDLDNFKAVNDSLGHAAGDVLLTQVAERVHACLRRGDTVARLGGDEFAILLEEVRSADETEAMCRRILASLNRPFDIEGKELIMGASIGVALSTPDATTDADTLLRNADVAMYAAKSQGKGCFRMFEPSMHVSMMERLELLADLQRALDRGEFMLQYQPMFLLETRQLCGVEALVRWQHPRRGLLPPADFIHLAEESSAILQLGAWVLTEACRQAADWQSQFPSDSPWTMSVNVSVKQLQNPAFASEVALALRESGLEPGRLILEITESVMATDVPSMLSRLHELKELGVGLAIDDFGTGYSSLGYLREFPFDLLKIDKSFIDDLGAIVQPKDLTKAIIELGKTLDLELVAEGIEDGAQVERLRSLHCDLGQGFYFSRPLDHDAVADLFRTLRQEPDAA